MKTWGEALKTIPRISKEEWNNLDFVAKWLVMTRSAVIIMTFISAAIAGLLAWKDYESGVVAETSVWRWVLLAIGLVFAHAANNIINDITDFKKGVDVNNYYRTLYGPQPLQQGLMTIGQIMQYLIPTGLIAIAAGIPLVLFGGKIALILMILGALFVLFYTWPLKYIGMGEIVVFIIWGPLMIGGGYYVITHFWSWDVVIASLPYGLAATTVLFGKHIDKMQDDLKKKIYTLPALLGEKVSRYSVIAMFIFQYLAVFYLIYVGYFSWIMLIVLVALVNIVKPIKMYSKPRPNEAPVDLPAGVWPLWFSAASFIHTRLYGMMFVLGLIGEVIMSYMK